MTSPRTLLTLTVLTTVCGCSESRPTPPITRGEVPMGTNQNQAPPAEPGRLSRTRGSFSSSSPKQEIERVDFSSTRSQSEEDERKKALQNESEALQKLDAMLVKQALGDVASCMGGEEGATSLSVRVTSEVSGRISSASVSGVGVKAAGCLEEGLVGKRVPREHAGRPHRATFALKSTAAQTNVTEQSYSEVSWNPIGQETLTPPAILPAR